MLLIGSLVLMPSCVVCFTGQLAFPGFTFPGFLPLHHVRLMPLFGQFTRTSNGPLGLEQLQVGPCGILSNLLELGLTVLPVQCQDVALTHLGGALGTARAQPMDLNSSWDKSALNLPRNLVLSLPALSRSKSTIA